MRFSLPARMEKSCPPRRRPTHRRQECRLRGAHARLEHGPEKPLALTEKVDNVLVIDNRFGIDINFCLEPIWFSPKYL